MSDTEKKVRGEFALHIGFASAFSVILMFATRTMIAAGVGTATAWTVRELTGSDLADNFGWGAFGILLLTLVAIPRLRKAVNDHGEVVARTGRIIRDRYS